MILILKIKNSRVIKATHNKLFLFQIIFIVMMKIKQINLPELAQLKFQIKLV